MSDLMAEFRNYLVGTGLVRHYTTVGAAPPLYVEPANGVPSPEDTGVSLVLAAFRYGGPVASAYESFLRRDIIQIDFRASTTAKPSAVIDVWALESKLREAIADKRAWQMGALTITESLEWRSLQRVSSDLQGHNYNMAFLFWRPADDWVA